MNEQQEAKALVNELFSERAAKAKDLFGRVWSKFVMATEKSEEEDNQKVPDDFMKAVRKLVFLLCLLHPDWSEYEIAKDLEHRIMGIKKAKEEK